MPPHHTYRERWAAVVQLLRIAVFLTERPRSRRDVENKFGVSRRTALRLISALQQIFPVSEKTELGDSMHPVVYYHIDKRDFKRVLNL